MTNITIKTESVYNYDTFTATISEQPKMELNERSKQVRRDIFKLSKANGGYHYGGTFSCVEILIGLYDTILTSADRFILSKGHACWGYYVLLIERGFSPSLEGHPHLDLANGVHWTTGSEGHGFPAGVGMALARKLQKKAGKVYVIIGDGECQEGTTWESMLMAVQHKLDNLVVIIDFNGLQGSGFTNQILSVDRIGDVARTLGWFVQEIDGHSMREIEQSLMYQDVPKGQPQLVVAHTIKGRGVGFMENNPAWHACWPSEEYEREALEELM